MHCLQRRRSAWLRSSGVVAFAVAFLPCALPLPARGADGAAKAPDVIVFTNGDQLTGKLLRAVNGTVTFHSDIVGDVNVSWDKIKSIHSSQQFAVIQQGQKVTRKTPGSAVPQGTVAMENQQVLVSPAGGAAPKQIPAKNAQYVIDEGTYTKEVQSVPGWTHDWTGSATAGLALVQATQSSRSFNGAATAVRTIPNVAWLVPRTRTTLGFNDVYGSLSQPGVVTTKTSVLHAGAEQDWFVSPRFFALVDATFDHNFSQGLNLQQLYGAGFGYTALKTAKQELDLKADVHFERQSFGETPGVVPPVITPSKNLIGLNVGDTYALKLPHGMLFNQSLLLTPALNQVKAFSALFNAGLTFPVYKRFSFSTGVLDAFLNDPAAGSKKNSFQFTGGVTYTFQ